MPTQAIRIKTDPDPYEPFKIAQAYKVGDLIFVSGQAAIDGGGNLVAPRLILDRATAHGYASAASTMLPLCLLSTRRPEQECRSERG